MLSRRAPLYFSSTEGAPTEHLLTPEVVRYARQVTNPAWKYFGSPRRFGEVITWLRSAAGVEESSGAWYETPGS